MAKYLPCGTCTGFLLVSCILAFNCTAGPITNKTYLDLGLEELMNIEVTSVSKKKQRLSQVASAVFVISQEDIRRSGATNIPEALRLAPGIQVASIDANKWAVGSRGFFGLNGRFENKLLVLVDGRSVYSPLFSGVFWEIQDTMLQDIDRIEIIRGPGATLWGANAVNGVINIITKKAADTQGMLAVGTIGSEIRGEAGLRYGGSQNEITAYRVFAKYSNHDEAVLADGSDGADDWSSLMTGFRIDHTMTSNSQLSLHGDIFTTNAGETITEPVPYWPLALTFDSQNKYSGGNLVGKWTRALDDGANLELQAYYDRTVYNTSFLGTAVDTFDLDFHHHFQWQDSHDLIWGLGFRHITDSITNTYSAALFPDGASNHIFSAFLQDEITVLPESAHLILGSKIEYNDFTGLEIQPNIRFVWQKEQQSFWAAVSHAVRTPSRGERNSVIKYPLMLPGNPLNQSQLPVQNVIIGNPDIDSETLTAYEAGYRLQPLKDFSIDLAVFYNNYDEVRFGNVTEPVIDFSNAVGSPFLRVPLVVNNLLKGDTAGLEVAANWQVSDWWKIQASYSFLTMDIQSEVSIEFVDVNNLEDRSPHHQLSIRSSMNLSPSLEFDIWFRYRDILKVIDVNSQLIEIDQSYDLDIRLGWQPITDIELNLVGKNLLNDRSQEFAPEIFLTQPTEKERSVYLQLIYKF